MQNVKIKRDKVFRLILLKEKIILHYFRKKMFIFISRDGTLKKIIST